MSSRILARFAPHFLAMTLVFMESAAGARADDPNVEAEIKAMFQVGWKPSVQGPKLAQEHYETAAKLAPGDERVPFAMALVLLRNHKHKEAAQLLDAALSGGEALLPIRRVRIHLAVSMRDYSVATREMIALAERLSGEPLKHDAEEPYLEAAAFLGGVTEYLNTHSGVSLKPVELKVLEEQLQSHLKGARRETYDSCRTKQAATLSTALADEKRKALVLLDTQVAALKAQAAENTAEEKDFLAKNEAERLAHEVKAKAAAAEIATLNKNVVVLKEQINGGWKNVADLAVKIRRLELIQPTRARGPNVDRGDNEDYYRIEKQIKSLKNTQEEESRNVRLLQVKSDADLAKIEKIKTRNPSMVFMIAYKDKLRSFADRADSIVDQQSKATLLQDKYDTTDDINKVTSALIAKSQMLATYVELSLDDEKKQILASCRAK